MINIGNGLREDTFMRDALINEQACRSTCIITRRRLRRARRCRRAAC